VFFFVSVTLFIVAGLATGTDDPSDADGLSAEPRPYRHPFQQALLEDGRIALLDVVDAPDGRRYSIGDTIWEDEDGVVHVESGLDLLDVIPLTEDELAEGLARAQEAARLYTGAPVIGESLEAELGRTFDESTRIPVSIAIRRPENLTLYSEVERAIAQGRVRTTADLQAVRLEKLAEHQQRVAEAQAPVLAEIQRLGGEVVARYENLYGVSVLLTPDQIFALETHADVTRMDWSNGEMTPDDTYGTQISQGHQIDQLVENGYDGSMGTTGTTDDLVAAQIEGRAINDQHVGFRRGSGTATRIAGRYRCSSTSCVSLSSFDPTVDVSAHASAVGGLLLGSLMQGQDTLVADETHRRNRSGFARQARILAFAANGGAAKAMESVIGWSPFYTLPLANMSTSFYAGDPPARYNAGTDTLSTTANQMFEAGVLLFKSAGNDYGAGGAGLCTRRVTSPGSAIGVFTVAAYGQTPTHADQSRYVRQAPIRSTSSNGECEANGGRSIVDLAGFCCPRRVFSGSVNSGAAAYSLQNGCGGTSYAAPTVAGAALDFIDWYKRSLSDQIDSPGVLFSQMLIMGDREADRFKPRKTLEPILQSLGRRPDDDAALGWTWHDKSPGVQESIRLAYSRGNRWRDR
jgi:hypothetical protein